MRSGRACVARAVSVERGGMRERGCARRLGGWVGVGVKLTVHDAFGGYLVCGGRLMGMYSTRHLKLVKNPISGSLGKRGDGVRVISHFFYSARPSVPLRTLFFYSLKRASWGLHFCNLIGNRLKWALRGAFGSRGISKYRY